MLLLIFSILSSVSGYGMQGGSYSRANDAVYNPNNANYQNPGNLQFLSLRPPAASGRQLNSYNSNGFVPGGQPPVRNGNFNQILSNTKPTGNGNVNQQQQQRPGFPAPLQTGQPAALTGFGQPTPMGFDTGSKALQKPSAGIVPPKAICECYIGTLVGNLTRDLMDLVLPFGTSSTITTERTDTTCRDMESQCIQHCRIQQESCLPQGLRTVVPGQAPNISFGSYACKTVTTKEDIRRPAGVFYALDALFCKDEGFISKLDDMYCCINVDHPFLQGEQLRLYSPNCDPTFNTTGSPSTATTFPTKSLTSNGTTEEPMVIRTQNASWTDSSTTAFTFTLPNNSTVVPVNDNVTFVTLPGQTTTGTPGSGNWTSGMDMTPWPQFPISTRSFDGNGTSGMGTTTWALFVTSTFAPHFVTSGSSDTFMSSTVSTPPVMFSDSGSSGPAQTGLTWMSDGVPTTPFPVSTTSPVSNNNPANVQVSINNGPISMDINISAPINNATSAPNAWTTGSTFPASSFGNTGFQSFETTAGFFNNVNTGGQFDTTTSGFFNVNTGSTSGNWETTTSGFGNTGFQSFDTSTFAPVFPTTASFGETTTGFNNVPVSGGSGSAFGDAFPTTFSSNVETWTSSTNNFNNFNAESTTLAPINNNNNFDFGTTTFAPFNNNNNNFNIETTTFAPQNNNNFNSESTTFASVNNNNNFNVETTTFAPLNINNNFNVESTTFASGNNNFNVDTTAFTPVNNFNNFNPESTTFSPLNTDWTTANSFLTQDLSGTMFSSQAGFVENGGFDATTMGFVGQQS